MTKSSNKIDDGAARKNNAWGSKEYQDTWDRINESLKEGQKEKQENAPK